LIDKIRGYPSCSGIGSEQHGRILVIKQLLLAKTSSATATRDLSDLVDKGVFSRTGERKSTRYYLKIKSMKGM